MRSVVKLLGWALAALALGSCGPQGGGQAESEHAADSGNTRYASELRVRLKAFREQPDSGPAAADLAQLYHANGQYAEAIEVYRDLTRLRPDEARWHYLLARVYLDLGETDAAVDLLEKVNRIEPDYVVAWLKRAEALAKTGRRDEAIEAYQGCLQRSPEYPFALLGLGRLAVEEENWERAEELLKRAVSHDPTLASGFMLLVSVLEATGAPPEHSEYARQQGDRLERYREPADPWFDSLFDHCFDAYRLSVLADQYGSTQRYEQAKLFYQRALEVDPEAYRLHRDIGAVYLETDDMERAVFHARRALELNPASDGAQFVLVEALNEARLRRGDEDSAELVAVLEAGLRTHPASTDLLHQAGSVYYELGRIEASEQAFRKAYRIDPHSLDLATSLADLLWMQKRYGETRELYESIRDMASTDVLSRARLAIIYLEEGEYGKAGTCLDEALAIDPENTMVRELKAGQHLREGNLHFRKGDLDRAGESYRSALRMKEDFAEAMTNLVMTYLRLGRSDEAVVLVESFLEREPQAHFAYLLLGDLYLLLEEPAKGLDAMERGLHVVEATGAQEAGKRMREVRQLFMEMKSEDR